MDKLEMSSGVLLTELDTLATLTEDEQQRLQFNFGSSTAEYNWQNTKSHERTNTRHTGSEQNSSITLNDDGDRLRMHVLPTADGPKPETNFKEHIRIIRNCIKIDTSMFPNEEEFDNHYTTNQIPAHVNSDTLHSSNEHFVCSRCNFLTSRKELLKRHIWRTHCKQNSFSANPSCSSTTMTGDLNKHVRIQTGKKPFACSNCDYKTTSKRNFTYHERVHSGEKPFACRICDFRTALKHNLKRHERIHTGVKPFECKICNYKASQRSAIVPHMRTHSGEKPFACGICDFKTAMKSNLKQHERNHVGEKTYACCICDFKTAIKSCLKQHDLIHTGEKPFACNTCDFRTSRKGTIMSHMRTHRIAKPFPCDI